MTFLRDFFDELFLKRGEEGGAPQPKMCVFGLKNDLFGKKDKSHNFLLKKYFSILWKHLRYGLTIFLTNAIL